MYDDTIETINLNETTRARLVPDYSPECPLEWGTIGSAHTIYASGRVMSMSNLGADDPEGDAIEEILSNIDNHTDLSEYERETAVLKHLERRGYHARIADVGGEDYHYAVFYDKGEYVSEATIKANIATYLALANGEVYGVVVEREKVWHSGDDIMTTWEPIDSRWGIYDPTEVDIREVAADILADSAAA